MDKDASITHIILKMCAICDSEPFDLFPSVSAFGNKFIHSVASYNSHITAACSILMQILAGFYRNIDMWLFAMYVEKPLNGYILHF